uniref:Uncharacterized protein n=1 Tax=Arundo donax TaxID=35708 RepID=A0A0A9BD00_ARUDO
MAHSLRISHHDLQEFSLGVDQTDDVPCTLPQHRDTPTADSDHLAFSDVV